MCALLHVFGPKIKFPPETAVTPDFQKYVELYTNDTTFYKYVV